MTCRHCRGSSWRRSSRWALGMTALASLLLGDYARAQALAERAARVLPADVSDQAVQLVLRTKRDSPLPRAGSLARWLAGGDGVAACRRARGAGAVGVPATPSASAPSLAGHLGG